MYVCVCVHVSVECMCTCVRVFMFTRVCSVACCSVTDPLVRSGPVIGDLDLYRYELYTSDSKTDLWSDPEIRTSSCSEDQTAIGSKIASFHVSVCSYVIFLIYCYQ